MSRQTVVTVAGENGERIVTQAWCAGCSEMVMPTDKGRCCWCDRQIIAKVVQKPRRQRGTPAKVTDAQLAEIHRVYVERGVSVRQVAEKLWRQFGYASPNACANSLYYLLNTRGFATRTVSEAVTRRNHKHGLSPRDWQERKRRRVAAGLTQKGKVRQPSCARCRRPATRGSDFCWSHDPATADERAAHTAKMRARSPILNRDDLEPAAPLAALLLEYRAQGGAWRDLGRLTGVPDFWLAHVAQGKQNRVAVARAARVREALGGVA